MNIPTYKRLIGDKVFTEFIKGFNCNDINNSLDKFNISSEMVSKNHIYICHQTILKIFNKSYIFFNSTINYFSNEPISESDKVLINHGKNKLPKNTLFPDLSFNQYLNLLLEKNIITTILLGENNGQLYLVEKDYKYRVVVFNMLYKILPYFNFVKIDGENYRLDDSCPNILYVGATRASWKLILIQDYRSRPLEFLNISKEDIILFIVCHHFTCSIIFGTK